MRVTFHCSLQVYLENIKSSLCVEGPHRHHYNIFSERVVCDRTLWAHCWGMQRFCLEIDGWQSSSGIYPYFAGWGMKLSSMPFFRNLHISQKTMQIISDFVTNSILMQNRYFKFQSGMEEIEITIANSSHPCKLITQKVATWLLWGKSWTCIEYQISLSSKLKLSQGIYKEDQLVAHQRKLWESSARFPESRWLGNFLFCGHWFLVRKSLWIECLEKHSVSQRRISVLAKASLFKN